MEIDSAGNGELIHPLLAMLRESGVRDQPHVETLPQIHIPIQDVDDCNRQRLLLNQESLDDQFHRLLILFITSSIEKPLISPRA